MDAEQIKLALASATTMKMIEHLRDSWHGEDQEKLFHAFFPIAVNNQSSGPAYAAAKLLYELNPPCQVNCKQAVEAMLRAWDVSIEEVPFYLCNQFGARRVMELIDKTYSVDLNNEQAARLRAIKYWAEKVG